MKACIFDLDGTLTDTLDSLVYSVNTSLGEMSLPPITREQVRRFVGNGARVLIERALIASGDEGASRIEEGMETYRRVFGENCMYHVKPYDGIPDVLETMKRSGMKIAVLSNKPHNQTVHVVETVFGKGYFEYVQGQIDGIPKKPDPGCLFELMDKMGVSKEECLYVGDSEVDVATGNAAGVTCIGVEWGFRDRQDLIDAGAMHLADNPSQLLRFIDKEGSSCITGSEQ